MRSDVDDLQKQVLKEFAQLEKDKMKAIELQIRHRFNVLLWFSGAVCAALLIFLSGLELPGGREIAVALLSLMGAALILLAWRFDATRYEPQKEIISIEIDVWRSKYPWLPPLLSRPRKLLEQSTSPFKLQHYSSVIWLLIEIATVSIALKTYALGQFGPYLAYGTVCLGSLLGYAVTLRLHKVSENLGRKMAEVRAKRLGTS